MNMHNHTTEELVLDNYFRKWVKGELPAEDHYWENWMAKDPANMGLVHQAMTILDALSMHHDVLSEKHIDIKVDEIMSKQSFRKSNHDPTLFSYGWKLVACLILIAGFAWIVYLGSQSFQSNFSLLSWKKTGPTIEKINNSDHPLRIGLSDGSTIILQPLSRVRFPVVFAKDKREIILVGEAYFDIIKNPERPFLVYANQMVTKVLGTSFIVKSYKEDKEVTVQVITGRVLFTPIVSAHKNSSFVPHQTDGVILTPNQMAIYSKNSERISRSLVNHPVIIKTSDKKPSDYNFRNTPIHTAFKALEEGYGVNIVYDKELLKDCTITAPLENEILYDKLDLICKVIRASYEVIDAQIIITSRGCN